MITLTNTSPHSLDSQQFSVKHNETHLGTLVVNTYYNDGITPAWRAELFGTDNRHIAATPRMYTALDADYLVAWVGHQLNLRHPDVIAADVKDPSGAIHHLVWHAVDLPGYDADLAARTDGADYRLILWKSPNNPPVTWEPVGKSDQYASCPTTWKLHDNDPDPVTSYKVAPGEILAPGDFYEWVHDNN